MANESIKSLYDKLYAKQAYTKSFDEFQKKYGTEEGQHDLYQKLNQKGAYTKSEDEFKQKYFSDYEQPVQSSVQQENTQTGTQTEPQTEEPATQQASVPSTPSDWSSSRPWSSMTPNDGLNDMQRAELEQAKKGRQDPISTVPNGGVDQLTKSRIDAAGGYVDGLGGRGYSGMTKEEEKQLREEETNRLVSLNKAAITQNPEVTMKKIEAEVDEYIKNKGLERYSAIDRDAIIHNEGGYFKQEDIDRLNNPKTGEEIQKYVLELYKHTKKGEQDVIAVRNGVLSEEEFINRANAEYANYIDSHSRKIGQKAAKEGINNIENKLQEIDKKNIEKYHNLSEAEKRNEALLQAQGVMSARDQMNMYSTGVVRDILKRSKETIDAIENDGGLGKGFKSGVTDLSGWISSYGLMNEARILEVTNRYNKLLEKYGDKLTDEKTRELMSEEDMLVLDALATDAAVQTYYGNLLSKSYKAGLTTGASLPFMMEFMLAPYSATDKAIENGVERAVVGFAKRTLKNNGVDAAKHWATRAFKKAVSTTLTPAVMTATIGAPQVAAGTAERMSGQATFDIDKNGRPVYAGSVDKQDIKEALWNSYNDAFWERASERMLEPIGKGASKVVNKKAANGGFFNKVKKVYDAMSANSLLRHSHVGNIIEENAEEIVGGTLKALCCSDQELSDVWSKESLEETFLGLLPMSLLGMATSGGVTYAQYRSNKKAIDTQAEVFTNSDSGVQSEPEHINPIAENAETESNTEQTTEESKRETKRGDIIREQMPEFPESLDENDMLAKIVRKTAKTLTNIAKNNKASVEEKTRYTNTCMREFYRACADALLAGDMNGFTKEQKQFVISLAGKLMSYGGNFDLMNRGLNLKVEANKITDQEPIEQQEPQPAPQQQQQPINENEVTNEETLQPQQQPEPQPKDMDNGGENQGDSNEGENGNVENDNNENEEAKVNPEEEEKKIKEQEKKTSADYDYIHAGKVTLRIPKGKVKEDENGNVDINATIDALENKTDFVYQLPGVTIDWTPVNTMSKNMIVSVGKNGLRTEARIEQDAEQAQAAAKQAAEEAQRAAKEAEQIKADTLPTDKEGNFNLDKFNPHHWWLYFNQADEFKENPANAARSLLKEWISNIQNLKQQQKGTGVRQGIINSNAILRNENNVKQLFNEMGITDENQIKEQRAAIEKEIADDKKKAEEEEKARKEEDNATTENKQSQTKQYSKMSVAQLCEQYIEKFGDEKGIERIKKRADNCIFNAAKYRMEAENADTAAKELDYTDKADALDKEASEYISFLNSREIGYDRIEAEQKALEAYNTESQREVNEKHKAEVEARRKFEGERNTIVGNIEAVRKDVVSIRDQALSLSDEVDLENEEEKQAIVADAPGTILQFKTRASEASTREELDAIYKEVEDVRARCENVLSEFKTAQAESKRKAEEEEKTKRAEARAKRAEEKAKRAAEEYQKRMEILAEKLKQESEKTATLEEKRKKSELEVEMWENKILEAKQKKASAEEIESLKKRLNNAEVKLKKMTKDYKDARKEADETQSELDKLKKEKEEKPAKKKPETPAETETKEKPAKESKKKTKADEIVEAKEKEVSEARESVMTREELGKITNTKAKRIKKINERSRTIASRLIENEFEVEQKDGYTVIVCGEGENKERYVLVRHYKESEDGGTNKNLSPYLFVDLDVVENKDSELHKVVALNSVALNANVFLADDKDGNGKGIVALFYEKNGEKSCVLLEKKNSTSIDIDKKTGKPLSRQGRGSGLSGLYVDGKSLQLNEKQKIDSAISEKGIEDYTKKKQLNIGGTSYSFFSIINGFKGAEEAISVIADDVAATGGTILGDIKAAMKTYIKDILVYAKNFGIDYGSVKEVLVDGKDVSFIGSKNGKRKIYVIDLIKDIAKEEKKGSSSVDEEHDFVYPENENNVSLTSSEDISNVENVIDAAIENNSDLLNGISEEEKAEIDRIINGFSEVSQIEDLSEMSDKYDELAAEADKLLSSSDKSQVFIETLAAKLAEVGYVTDQVVLINNKSMMSKYARQRTKSGKIKGWYDTATGKVYIYAPNITTPADYMRTVFHEMVGHYGLRKLLGQRNYDNLCAMVYDGMTSSEKLKWREYAERELNSNEVYQSLPNEDKEMAIRQTAADEYMAKLAEEGCRKPQQLTTWQKIKNFIRGFFNRIGLAKLNITDYDIAMLLYESKMNIGDRGLTEAEKAELERIINIVSDRMIGNEDVAVYANFGERRMVAYHGSTEKFDNFDKDFAGSGIGNQMFGYGTYVAAKKDAAKLYAIEAAEANNSDEENLFVYEVDIPDDIEDRGYLDWDKTYSKKDAETILTLFNEFNDTDFTLDDFDISWGEGGFKATGESIYRAIEEEFGSRNASEMLNYLFDGIKVKGDYGTNYVLFNADDVKIKNVDNVDNGDIRYFVEGDGDIEIIDMNQAYELSEEEAAQLIEEWSREETERLVEDNGFDKNNPLVKSTINSTVSTMKAGLGKAGDLFRNQLEEWFDSRLMLRLLRNAINNVNGSIMRPAKDFFVLANNIASQSRGMTGKFREEVGLKFTSTFVDIVDNKIVKIFKQNGRERATELMKLYMLAKDYVERIEINETDSSKYGGYTKLKVEWWKNMQEALADENGIGMTQTFDTPYEFIEAVETTMGTQDTTNFWESWNNCSQFIRDELRKHNVLTQEEYDDMNKRKYYVPQRGKADNSEDGFFDDFNRHTALGSYKALKKAKGRSSIAQDPVASLYQLANSSFRDCVRNDALVALYNYWTDSRLKAVFESFGVSFSNSYQAIVTDANGNEVQQTVTQSSIEDKKKAKEELTKLESEYKKKRKEYVRLTNYLQSVKKGSVEYDLAYEKREEYDTTELSRQIETKKAEIAEMYKFVAPSKLNGQVRFRLPETGEWVILSCDANNKYGKQIPSCFINMPQKVGNKGFWKYPTAMRKFVSQTFTTKNPLFAPKGFIRGIQSTIKLAFIANPKLALEVSSQLLKVHKSNVVWNYVATGKTNDADLAEYFEMGGSSGLSSAFDDLDKIKHNIESDMYGRSFVENVGKYADRTAGYLGEVGEMYLRFSVYKAAKELEFSPNEAIRIAKECDVNYDRTGRQQGIAGYAASLIPFVNASIQASGAIYNAVDKNNFYATGTQKQRWARAGGVTAYNFLIKGFIATMLFNTLLDLMRSDDDDEKFVDRMFTIINDASSGKDLTSVEYFEEMNRIEKMMFNWYRYSNITSLQYGNIKFPADQRDMWFGAGLGADLAIVAYYGLQNSVDAKDYMQRQFVDRFCSCISPISGFGFHDMPIVEMMANITNFNSDLRGFNNPQAAYYSRPWRNADDYDITVSRWVNDVMNEGEVYGNIFGENFDISPEWVSSMRSLFANPVARDIFSIMCKSVQRGEGVDWSETALVKGYYNNTIDRSRKNIDQLVSFSNTKISEFYDMRDKVEDARKSWEKLAASEVTDPAEVTERLREYEEMENEWNEYLINSGADENTIKALSRSLEILDSYDIRKLGAKSLMTPSEYYKAQKEEYMRQGMNEKEAGERVDDMKRQWTEYFMKEVLPIVSQFTSFEREYDGTGDKLKIKDKKPIIRNMERR